MPFVGAEKEFLTIAFEYERLYLVYERLWYDLENGRMPANKAETLFYQYREKEVEIERSSKINCPEIRSLIQKAQSDTESALALNFATGVNDEH